MIVETYVVQCDCAKLYGDHGAGCPRELVTAEHSEHNAGAHALEVGWRKATDGYNWLSPECVSDLAQIYRGLLS